MAEQNGNPLSGDALITFGFRRVIEEMQELRGCIAVLTSSIDGLALCVRDAGVEAKNAADAVKRLYNTADKIEHNTFMMNDALMRSATSLEKIQANTFTAEMNCIRLANDLRREDTDDMEQRLEGV